MISPEFSYNTPRTLDDQWYLALDIGSGLSACLVNRNCQKVYPIYWETQAIDRENPGSDLITFRVPCEVDWQERVDGFRRKLKNIKSYLNLAIPYIRIAQDNASEVSQVPIPLIQLSNKQTVFLGKFQRALQLLLSTLTPEPQKQFKGLILSKLYRCQAEELDLKTLYWILERLTGVIVGFSSQATEAYRFNVEKAILDANLVKGSEQIFWLEDPIAIFLGQYYSGKITLSGGSAFILDAGSTTTEMAIVELPDQIENLDYTNFICHSWAYGAEALDLDIVCQLLLNSLTGKQLQSQVFLDQDLILPQPGFPDLQNRYRLRQQLQSQPVGIALLEAATSLKLILSQQRQYTLEIEEYYWELNSTDLERLVLVPFINQLNAELNTVIVQAGISSIGINQTICVGENGNWISLNRWLRQKFPNAILLKKPHQEPEIVNQQFDQIQVAIGLANLPLYPQVLDRSRHQYRDYFLLKELLKAFEGRSLSLNDIMQVLESRGINTRSCQSRIVGILDGQLPLGLVPQEPEIVLIHPASQRTPDYQCLSPGKLFTQDENNLYRLNAEQASEVRQYLKQLFSDFPQYLEEPAIVSL